jgi:hypothetical protein
MTAIRPPNGLAPRTSARARAGDDAYGHDAGGLGFQVSSVVRTRSKYL